MIESSYQTTRLFAFPHMAGLPGLVHAFAGRPQNYAPHRGIGRDRAVQARQEVCRAISQPFDRLTAPEQVMRAEVVPIEPEDVGAGREGRESAVRYVDGLITDQTNVPIVMLSADCPIIACYDPDWPAIGTVHAGWQGTVARAAENLVHQMQHAFDSQPQKLRVGICPSAGPCCYEVGEPVRRIARTRLKDPDACFTQSGGRLTFNLWEANRRQLVGAGVPESSIELAGICTICDERFWSHRRDGGQAGRNAMFIALKP